MNADANEILKFGRKENYEQIKASTLVSSLLKTYCMASKDCSISYTKLFVLYLKCCSSEILHYRKEWHNNF